MKRKITSLIYGLALMLTMFCVPVGAAERIVAYRYGTIVGTANYDFMLGVVTASAATTGESKSGLSQMNCSMFIDTASGRYWNSGRGHFNMEVTLSGYGNITYAQTECWVTGITGSMTLYI